MTQKTIETTSSHFTSIGLILLGISLATLGTSYTALSPTLDYIQNNFALAVVGIIAGIVFTLLGFKKKIVTFNDNSFNYIVSKKDLTVTYTAINLIHTFIDTNNRSRNLLICFDDKMLSFSSSFWPESKMQEIYSTLVTHCQIRINDEQITLQNELNW